MKGLFARACSRKCGHFATLALMTVIGTSALPASGRAGYLDLTDPGTVASGSITGSVGGTAQFEHTTFQSAGSGVLRRWYAVHLESGGPTEHGYNTGQPNILDSKVPNGFNPTLRLSNLAVTTLGGVDYYRFLLDINEAGGGAEFLSVDELKVYTNPTVDPENQTATNPSQLGTLRFDLGAGNGVLLDGKDQQGSGTGDMIFYVPTSAFAGAGASDFIYLYSKFGVVGEVGPRDYSRSDGFEEWAAFVGQNQAVPLPPSALMAAFGLAPIAGAAGLRRLRRKAA